MLWYNRSSAITEKAGICGDFHVFFLNVFLINFFFFLKRLNFLWLTPPVFHLEPHCFLIIFTFIISDDLAAYLHHLPLEPFHFDTGTQMHLVHYLIVTNQWIPLFYCSVCVWNLIYPGRGSRTHAIHHLSGSQWNTKLSQSFYYIMRVLFDFIYSY